MSMSQAALAAFRRQPSAKPAPKIAGLKFVGVDDYRSKGVPARQQATYSELRRQFRGGDLHAFSWDPRAEQWLVWRTEADWLATERNGKVARPDLAAQGHGPEVFEPVAAPKKKATPRKRTAPPAPVAEAAPAPIVPAVVAPAPVPATPAPSPVAGTMVDVSIAGRMAVLIAQVSAHPDPAAALDVLELVAKAWTS